jgi:hypothetical protein
MWPSPRTPLFTTPPACPDRRFPARGLEWGLAFLGHNWVTLRRGQRSAFPLWCCRSRSTDNPARAVSEHYNCLIPPKANVLKVPIRAGEMDAHYQ